MSPDLTELINSAEKATAVAPEAQPTAAGAAEAPNGEAEAEEDDEDEVDEGAAAGTDKKKKKKKPKKKKKATAGAVQSDPPRVPLSSFFKPDAYPSGEICDYVNDNAWRTTSEEKRHQERIEQAELPLDSPYNFNSIRKASEVHRQVRQYARKNIKVGMSMTEIAEMIENATRALVGEDGLKAGIGFPTGVNRNHIAAHFSPNAGDKTVLEYEDVIKIDFGVQVNGRIVDSAFTMSFDHTYDQLIAAVNDATNTGVREAGIDVRMGDIGAAIQEAMESYEVVIGSKTLPIKSIRNLTGHSITPYSIHGGDNGKSVPIVAQHGPEGDVKMEEGEYFAIETFGSTGRGYVRNEGVCSHYARDTSVAMQPLKLQSAKKLMGTIDREFGTLPWCRRYLDRIGESGYLLGLRELVEKGIIRDYPPLVDDEGSQTAQLEHTILLRPTCKEVVSRGDDY